jgi:hypothetical protein
MDMKGHEPSVALYSAIHNYVKSLKRAFPAEPWPSVKHYAERAWLAADEVEVHWEQVESHLKVARAGLRQSDTACVQSDLKCDSRRPTKVHRYVSVSGPSKIAPARECGNDAEAVGVYEEWSVARRALQNATKAGREAFRDPALDYGSHG